LKIVFSILILLCLSCNPQKQLNRLTSRHPELLQKDTIRYIDTVIVENYTHDTITNIQLHDSTTVINNEKVILKYYYDTLTKEIHHHVTCIGDTITKEVHIPYEVVVVQELTFWQKYGSIMIILSFIALALLLFKRISKILL
tara:strand:+ start:1069 stop:1494 length:426 start_codon:yes stop_codon:yes gene_type:complete